VDNFGMRHPPGTCVAKFSSSHFRHEQTAPAIRGAQDGNNLKLK
jgi:hypothetical protein